jgi:hypothetical protein
MRRRFLLPVIALVLAATFEVSTQPLGAKLPESLDALVAGNWQPNVTAAFGTFTCGYTDIPSPFSRWLEEELAWAVSKSGRLKLFNRSAAAAMDPALKGIYGDFFEKNGVDALLAGCFMVEGTSVKARLELTGLSDGLLIGTTDVHVSLPSLPPSLDIEPRPAVKEKAATLSGMLPRTVTAAPSAAQPSAPDTVQAGFSVTASTDRGRGAVYREGEGLVVLATVNQPAFLRICHIDVLGRVQRIWPNRFGGGDGRIASGEIVRIPGTSDPFSFRMEAPYGTEFIKVVASTQAFMSNDADFTDLGGDSRTVITRGLPVLSASGPPLFAEDLASYVILPAK